MASENDDEIEISKEKNLSNQISSVEKEFYIISDKNNKYTINLSEEDDNLNISASTIVNNITNNYSKLVPVDNLSEINYFKKLGIENLEDIIEELWKLLKENDPTIIESTNLIILNIQTGSKKIPDILITLDYVVNYQEKILELENSNKILNDEIKELKSKIDDLYSIIDQFKYTKKKIKTAELLYEVKAHEDQVVNFFILSDGRICSSSVDSKIKIFEKKKNTFSENICIEANDKEVDYVFELKDGGLLSCSKDGKIYIFDIYQNKYSIRQKIDAHKETICKAIELPTGVIVSISIDKDMKFWRKDEKTKTYSNSLIHPFSDILEDIILLNEKEFAFSMYNKSERTGTVEFFNYKNNQKSGNLEGFNTTFWSNKVLFKIDDKIMFLAGCYSIYVINFIEKRIINEYRILNDIDDKIFCFCKLSEEVFLCGCLNKKSDSGSIVQIKYNEINNENKNEGKNAIKIISIKNNVHNGIIYRLEKYNDEIISCSKDTFIKVWKF